MALKEHPTQHNFLNPNGFELVIRRLPYTTFFCQEVILPGISLPPINTGNPFINLNYSASSIDVGELSVSFKVDENLKNYIEMLNWIKGLGFPESFDQYKDNKTTYKREAIRSDASLIITSSNKVPNLDITLVDLVPIRLSPMKMVTNDQEVSYVTATASFSLRDFYITDISDCVPAAD